MAMLLPWYELLGVFAEVMGAAINRIYVATVKAGEHEPRGYGGGALTCDHTLSVYRYFLGLRQLLVGCV